MISIGVFIALVIGIRQVHHFSWWKAITTLAITFLFSDFALIGLVLCPFMLILGT